MAVQSLNFLPFQFLIILQSSLLMIGDRKRDARWTCRSNKIENVTDWEFMGIDFNQIMRLAKWNSKNFWTSRKFLESVWFESNQAETSKKLKFWVKKQFKKEITTKRNLRKCFTTKVLNRILLIIFKRQKNAPKLNRPSDQPKYLNNLKSAFNFFIPFYWFNLYWVICQSHLIKISLKIYFFTCFKKKCLHVLCVENKLWIFWIEIKNDCKKNLFNKLQTFNLLFWLQIFPQE